jgi:isopenicillin N synthase-like dioxygenase
MEAWVEAMTGLGRRLAQLLAGSLDLPAAFFDAALREPLVYTQLFRYPSLAGASALARGAGAHVDWGMLTILAQDDVGGLEVRDAAGAWHPVPPIAHTFVIILGELMVRYTGGAYRSPMHRVTRNTSGRDRYSMPAFFDPAYDEVVACVPTCRPRRGEPRFPPRTVMEHMREMRHDPLSHSYDTRGFRTPLSLMTRWWNDPEQCCDFIAQPT